MHVIKVGSWGVSVCVWLIIKVVSPGMYLIFVGNN